MLSIFFNNEYTVMNESTKKKKTSILKRANNFNKNRSEKCEKKFTLENLFKQPPTTPQTSNILQKIGLNNKPFVTKIREEKKPVPYK